MMRIQLQKKKKKVYFKVKVKTTKQQPLPSSPKGHYSQSSYFLLLLDECVREASVYLNRLFVCIYDDGQDVGLVLPL